MINPKKLLVFRERDCIFFSVRSLFVAVLADTKILLGNHKLLLNTVTSTGTKIQKPMSFGYTLEQKRNSNRDIKR